MHYSGDFPNFFLPVDRVFGFELPVTRRGKPNGSMLVTGQLKRMTPQLREELVDLLADMLVAEFTSRGSSSMPATPPVAPPSTASPPGLSPQHPAAGSRRGPRRSRRSTGPSRDRPG